MKIFMIGEAANHKDKLAAALNDEFDIVALPHAAAQSPDHDAAIAPQDVVITLRLSRPRPLPPFRLLHLPGAGTDGIDFAALPETCWVCNVFEHEIPIAEFVLQAMLDWAIRPEELRRRFGTEGWSEAYRHRRPHGELFGQTLGLIGFGRIGRAIAQRARAFGLRVLALSRSLRAPVAELDGVVPPEELPRLLAASDFLVVACPLTADTRGLIGRAELDAMKPTAVVVNVSRAEILEEEALFRALESRRIAGAYLDVWYAYPQGPSDRVAPARFPFAELPNAICTPHSSAWTENLPARRYGVIAENIRRLASGRPLLNVVAAPAHEAEAGALVRGS